MTEAADKLAKDLRYLAQRVRKGERLDDCDAAVMAASADRLMVLDTTLAAAEARMESAASILGRER